MEQRLDEWTNKYNDDYYNRQFNNPYQSTIKFCDWLEQLGAITNQSDFDILDIGTGKGANIYYMNHRFPNCKFTGLDINHEFIKEGNTFFGKGNIKNCKLEYGDLYNLDLKKLANRYEGIVSYQTLSWLPEYETALDEMLKINPKWISLTSLFYDGLVDCKIEVQEYSNAHDTSSYKTSFYNIYSLPRIKKYLADKGFGKFEFHSFEIDIDLPKPEHSHMQTYTITLNDGKRIQMSGPLCMSWYFIYAAQ